MTAQDYLPNEGRKWRNEVTDTARYRNYKGPGPGISSRVDNLGPLYEVIGEQVKKASRIASSHWHGLLDADEIEQEIWLEIAESKATAEKLRDADKDLLVDLLIRLGERICIKERNDYEVFTGNFHYSVNEVKAMAPVILTFQGNETEEVMDFLDGLELLKTHWPEYADAIIKRYAHDEYMSTKQEKNYLSNGLTKLTDLMNKSRREAYAEQLYGPRIGSRVPKDYDMYEGDWDAQMPEAVAGMGGGYM